MNLPELALQALYARLAWGVVLAAVIVCGVWRAPRSSRAVPAVVVLALGVMWLPGAASPAHWLALAFQWPSALLVALCAAVLVGRARQEEPPATGLLPLPLAIVLAVGGAGLYADASGWLSAGIYATGFGRVAPAAGLAVGLLGAAVMVRGAPRGVGAALLAAAALYAFARLPTGNVFDAFLDPFLWGWALWAVLSHAGRRVRARRRPRASL